jgi:hypothetical protein
MFLEIFLALVYVIGYSITFLNIMPFVRKNYNPLTDSMMTSVAIATLYWPLLVLFTVFMTILEILHIV